MDVFEKFYNKSLRFLSYRPRSEKEVRDNLNRKKPPQDIIERIIKKLKEQKFLDDEEFAKWWVEQRTNFKPRSVRLIKIELRQKGVPADIIESQILNPKSQIPNDAELAEKLINKKLPRYKDLSKEELYRKLGRFLASKGFNWETIKQGIDEVLGKGV